MVTLAMSVSEASNLLTMLESGNTKGGSITVPLTSCLTGLDQSVLQIKIKIVSCHTANFKQVKQEVNGTVFPAIVLIYNCNVFIIEATGFHFRKFISIFCCFVNFNLSAQKFKTLD